MNQVKRFPGLSQRLASVALAGAALGAVLNQDQRGEPRPAPSGIPSDIGAFEFDGDTIFADGFEALPL